MKRGLKSKPLHSVSQILSRLTLKKSWNLPWSSHSKDERWTPKCVLALRILYYFMKTLEFYEFFSIFWIARNQNSLNRVKCNKPWSPCVVFGDWRHPQTSTKCMFVNHRHQDEFNYPCIMPCIDILFLDWRFSLIKFARMF